MCIRDRHYISLFKCLAAPLFGDFEAQYKGNRVKILLSVFGIFAVVVVLLHPEREQTLTSAIVLQMQIFFELSLFPHVLCVDTCLLYTSPSPRDRQKSRMPSSA
eukprot:TRINITY_DN19138_c0_g1_i1.p1 TRINITY_DN19138_c0_g1~~TRINITY_DN19138_c0_g1_i1.p1  ORF type:complete len:113 (+),score=3.61 TRINITY_DN19138_c0_g1_i1:30-341(+)